LVPITEYATAIATEDMVTTIESNMKCPSHNPSGFDNPFESCIASTEEWRSFATYRAKNAGKIACDDF